jgi:hypothetical protein
VSKTIGRLAAIGPPPFCTLQLTRKTIPEQARKPDPIRSLTRYGVKVFCCFQLPYSGTGYRMTA